VREKALDRLIFVLVARGHLGKGPDGYDGVHWLIFVVRTWMREHGGTWDLANREQERSVEKSLYGRSLMEMAITAEAMRCAC
jgi:hypothetical protein